jgi:hypothetical protein
MSQAGYTPISLYYSTTAAAVPTSGNLANGELGINIQDEKLYFKNAAGTVKLLASNATSAPVLTFSAGTTGFTPSSATSGAVTLAGTLATTNGGTGLTSFTANGVVYASSSSALATGSGLVFDGSNLGLGVTPSAWGGALSAGMDFKYSGGIASHNSANAFYLVANGYYNSSGVWKYRQNGYANYVNVGNGDGSIAFYTAPSGTAGNSVTFTQAMTLDASGRLLVGTTSATANFNVVATQSADAPAGMMVENTSNTSSASAIVRYKSSSSTYAYTGLGSPSRASYAGLGANILSMYTAFDAGISLVVDNAAGPITFNTNSTERMRIESGGNVGIGTTSVTTGISQRVLQITNGTNGCILLGSGATQSPIPRIIGADTYDLGLAAGVTTGKMLFYTNDAERLRIADTGAFGLSGANYGTNGQVLTSSGSGSAPTWTTVSGGGSPGGSTTQVQYNNAGSFAGSSNMTFDGTRLTTAAITSSGVTNSFGSATNASVANLFSGTKTGYSMLSVDSCTLSPVATSDAGIVFIQPAVGNTIQKASTGTHANFASLYVPPPTIGAGASTLTNASSLYVPSAPSGATNNYAISVGSGTTYLNGLVNISGASGGQIQFPATQNASSDANTLDDYEEGTWTPVYTPSSGAFSTITYYVQYGFYQKIGNTVNIQMFFYTTNFSVGTATGQLFVTGLPFTAIGSSQSQSGTVGYTYQWDTNSPTKATVYQGTTRFEITRDVQGAVNSSPELTAANLKGGNPANGLSMAISYRVA